MIVLDQVCKSFEAGGRRVDAVYPVSLEIAQGDTLALMGPSGAGKSTLLRLMNRLEEPSGGRVLVDDIDVTALAPRALRAVRRRLGMVFQGVNLLANLRVVDNVALPLILADVSREDARVRALECLDQVHLAAEAQRYPAQLSGGQRQRVGIARAIATRPDALLCDEPTSALDPETTTSILDTLREINAALGVTLVVVTHDASVARRLCRRVVRMRDGRAEPPVPVEALAEASTEDPRPATGGRSHAAAAFAREPVDG